MQERKIKPADRVVKRIVIYYDESNAYLWGFQLFDKNNKKSLETASKYFKNCSNKECILQDDERIIGFKSRKKSEGESAWHYDF